MVKFNAIWDTGATKSVITQAVVDACGLAPTGMANVKTAAGPSQAETYLVNFGLPNRVGIPVIRVTKMQLTGGADILIGMDIISRGDFSVTNFNGATKFSFRMPSIKHIDYVEESERLRIQRDGRPTPKRVLRPNLSGGKKKGKQRNKRKRNRKK